MRRSILMRAYMVISLISRIGKAIYHIGRRIRRAMRRRLGICRFTISVQMIARWMMTKAEINADWRYNTGYIVLYNKKYIILVENLVLKKEICYDRGSITKIDMNTKIKLLVILACSLGLVANVEAGWYNPSSAG
jgi:hypothetical protein